MYQKIVKLFLRLAIGLGFLSAVADRFGIYWTYHIAWGDWGSFVDYTRTLAPWLPSSLVEPAAIGSTLAEIVLGIGLIIGFKTSFMAKCSGALLLVFALSMTLYTGAKSAFDAAVYAASAGAFALSLIRVKFLEIST